MIGFLSGRAAAGSLVVVNGVGYVVATASPLTSGETVELWIHTSVRENDISLYGFTSPGERELFSCLTKVTGVGPKVAMGLLSLGAGAVATALRDRDARALAQAPGVGIRKAEQLISAVALPAELTAQLATGADTMAELVNGLAAIGFDPAAARSTLEALAEAGISDEGLLMRRAMTALRAA